MKISEDDMKAKIKIDSYIFVYDVNGGRRFHKFQNKLLNKQRKPLIGGIITIITRLRLESNRERENEKVNVIDVNIKNTNKLKQDGDLSVTSTSSDSDDYVFSNLYGLGDAGSDYSDVSYNCTLSGKRYQV